MGIVNVMHAATNRIGPQKRQGRGQNAKGLAPALP